MYKHLTQAERYYIWRRKANLVSITTIAKELNISRSTIYRELERNSYANKYYDPVHAQTTADQRKSIASSSKKFKWIKPKLRNLLHQRLSDGWSPEQISGRLRKDSRSSISHQTIYNYVKHDKSCGGKLYKLLPHKGKKYNYRASGKCSNIPNRVDISERPAIIEQKKRVGDWEADTIIGKKDGSYRCLLTLVERKTKYTFVRKIHAKSAFYVQQAIEEIYSSTVIPFKTITPDNGGEFANHKQIQENINCQFYFARPYRSSDRGLNEHTNGLIRRFLPKKTDFAHISDDTIQHIQNSLNHRPRKVLGFLTPSEVMLKHLKRIYPKSDLLHFNL